MNPVYVTCAVEGDLDAAVAKRLIEYAGANFAGDRVYGGKGKARLNEQVQGYNQAARREPWFVLVDLDDDYPCGPSLRADWLPAPSELMCLRAAVHAVEAWLLADSERIATCLRVPEGRIPTAPELLDDPKQTMVQLAASSRKASIRRGMVPHRTSGARVGPEYTDVLRNFVLAEWRPEVAAERAPSLAGCIASLRRLVARSLAS